MKKQPALLNSIHLYLYNICYTTDPQQARVMLFSSLVDRNILFWSVKSV